MIFLLCVIALVIAGLVYLAWQWARELDDVADRFVDRRGEPGDVIYPNPWRDR